MALLINLALCTPNAQLIACEDGAGLHLITDEAEEHQSPLFSKLVRNSDTHNLYRDYRVIKLGFISRRCDFGCKKCDEKGCDEKKF